MESTGTIEAAGRGGVPPATPPALGWRRLQIIGALAVVASLVVPMAIQLTFESFIVAMAAPLVVALLVDWGWPRVGAVLIGVLSLALLLFSAPYLVQPLTHPEAFGDFVAMVVFTVGALVAVIATVPAFRAARHVEPESRTPRALAIAAAVVIIAGTVVAAVASAGVESVPAERGDILVVTEDGRFEPAGFHAEAGTVAVHVTNRDGTRHTFTIDELGVDLSIAPNSSERVSFAAEPGSYRFYCRPHAPGMEGSLVVG